MKAPTKQNPKTPRSSMLRADHPQTPIQVDSGQESWDRLRKKKIFLESGWPKLHPNLFFLFLPQVGVHRGYQQS
jgi:hypothetical protein